MNNRKTLIEGISIIILRTDGSTQDAIIAHVDHQNEVVSVEWIEKDGIKGKDIDFVKVYALNPELNPNNVQSKGNTPTQARPKSDARCRLIGSHSLISRNLKSNNHLSADLEKKTQMSVRPSQTVSNMSVSKRRESVVSQVEKLKRDREERRQRQAEFREEQKALMNMYPKNTNWQFAKMIQDYQATIDFKPLIGNEIVDLHRITVCVRKRPLNNKERNRNEIDVISVPKRNTIIVHEPKNKVDLTKSLVNQHFCFDYVFDENCSNQVVYKFTAKPLIETIFEGGMATCFAYGQTGSGKTHTMGGTFQGKKQNFENGIYLMAARDVFEYLNSKRYQNKNFIVLISFFEIYQDKVNDLLAKKAKLKVLENAKQQIQVVGLTEKVVNSPEEVLSLLKVGNSARACGKTAANSNSSRSHAVIQIALRESHKKQIYGKFSLIDLAGNERGVDTFTTSRVTHMESAEINKSLLALKECIRALGRKCSHLPFRQSKLTQVLRDSFVGEKSKTCMIAMISPGMASCEHTLNTLRYADRVKELNIAEEPVQEFIFVPNQWSLISNKDMEELKPQESNELLKDIACEENVPATGNHEESQNTNIMIQI